MAASEKNANISIAFLSSEGFSCMNTKKCLGKISLLIRGVINQPGDDGLNGILKRHMIVGVPAAG